MNIGKLLFQTLILCVPVRVWAVPSWARDETFSDFTGFVFFGMIALGMLALFLITGLFSYMNRDKKHFIHKLAFIGCLLAILALFPNVYYYASMIARDISRTHDKPVNFIGDRGIILTIFVYLVVFIFLLRSCARIYKRV